MPPCPLSLHPAAIVNYSPQRVCRSILKCHPSSLVAGRLDFEGEAVPTLRSLPVPQGTYGSVALAADTLRMPVAAACTHDSRAHILAEFLLLL